MSYKSIFITNPCKIHVKNNNIVVSNDDGDNLVALDSIASIVIETTRATITTYAISKLAEEGVAILYVDKKFSLNAITLPFHTHSTFSKIVHTQIDISKSFSKQIWQKIITQKIINQGYVLAYFNKTQQSKELMAYSKKVQSGDKENIEAIASRIYWSSLFENFVRVQRGAGDIKNVSLNYCYAIIRSAVIRSITNAGLMPSFGIHHNNYFNSFNLADDLIEPFRPFVDLHVKFTTSKFQDEVLTTEIKAELINILNLEFAMIDGGISNIRVAIDRLVQSYQKAVLEGKSSNLYLPTISFETYENECI